MAVELLLCLGWVVEGIFIMVIGLAAPRHPNDDRITLAEAGAALAFAIFLVSVTVKLPSIPDPTYPLQ